jgi:hypothetical protein
MAGAEADVKLWAAESLPELGYPLIGVEFGATETRAPIYFVRN